MDPLTIALLSGSAGFGAAQLFGDDDSPDYPMVDIPAYYQSPEFMEYQEYMGGYGKDILAGDIPDYYAPIGEYGSPQFEDVLQMTQRDVGRSVMEAEALRGGRAGSTPAVMGRAIGDVSTKMRWQDYLNAITGRKFLMSTGTGMIGDVTGNYLREQQLRNQYNLSRAQLEMRQEAGAFKIGESRRQAEDAMIADIIGSGLGTAGMLYGMEKWGYGKD